MITNQKLQTCILEEVRGMIIDMFEDLATDEYIHVLVSLGQNSNTRSLP